VDLILFIGVGKYFGVGDSVGEGTEEEDEKEDTWFCGVERWTRAATLGHQSITAATVPLVWVVFWFIPCLLLGEEVVLVEGNSFPHKINILPRPKIRCL
jgi:hypothetical protein